jgi:hypothetical protein
MSLALLTNTAWRSMLTGLTVRLVLLDVFVIISDVTLSDIWHALQAKKSLSLYSKVRLNIVVVPHYNAALAGPVIRKNLAVTDTRSSHGTIFVMPY